MRAGRRREFGEVLIALGAMAAAVIAVAAIVWFDIGRMQAEDNADSEAREELAQDALVIEAMVDQETGLRGFVLTGDPVFLKPYDDGRRQFTSAMQRLAVMTADDPPKLRRAAEDIAVQAQLWTDTVAKPSIDATRAHRRAPDTVQSVEVHMDAIRADIAALRKSEHQLLADRNALQERAFHSSRLTLVLGSAMATMFAIVIAGRSLRRLTIGRRDAEAGAAALAQALEGAHAAERSKTLFLSNMSHEMRTPLNGVAGMAEALGQTDLNPGQRELLSVICVSADTLDSLIGDLLTLSRGEDAAARPLDRKTFHLGDTIRAIVAESRPGAELKGLGLLCAVTPQADLRVVGDARRLHRLLTFLMSNAVKFTEHGQIRLTLDSLGAHRYRVEVADTGVGFDEARKADLFEKFSQSDDSVTRLHGGAGVGLARARQLAETLGGQLDCRSRLGEGSVFTFDIELPAASAEADRVVEEAAADADQALRVLVVDDHAINRKVLELFLDQLGVAWTSVEDGQQAVDATRAQAFSAILMDIQMPVMDGLTATREIRRLEQDFGRPATPVIIVSANCEPETVQAGRAAGARAHLDKPVSAQALVDALNEVLAEQAQAA